MNVINHGANFHFYQIYLFKSAFLRNVFDLFEIRARPLEIINATFSVRLILNRAFKTAQNEQTAVRLKIERFDIIRQLAKSRADALHNRREKHFSRARVNNRRFQTARAAAPPSQNVMSREINAFLRRVPQIRPIHPRIFIAR